MDLYVDYLYEVIDEYNPDHNFVFVKLAGEVHKSKQRLNAMSTLPKMRSGRIGKRQLAQR